MWSAPLGANSATPGRGPLEAGCAKVQVSSDGQRLATWCEEAVAAWNLLRGDGLREWEFPAHSVQVAVDDECRRVAAQGRRTGGLGCALGRDSRRLGVVLHTVVYEGRVTRRRLCSAPRLGSRHRPSPSRLAGARVTQRQPNVRSGQGGRGGDVTPVAGGDSKTFLLPSSLREVQDVAYESDEHLLLSHQNRISRWNPSSREVSTLPEAPPKSWPGTHI